MQELTKEQARQTRAQDIKHITPFYSDNLQLEGLFITMLNGITYRYSL